MVIIGLIIVLTGGEDFSVLITGVIIVLTGGHVFCADNRCGENRCDNSTDWERRFLW